MKKKKSKSNKKITELKKLKIRTFTKKKDETKTLMSKLKKDKIVYEKKNIF